MTNDVGQGITSTQFLTNLEAIVDQLHTDFPTMRMWITDSPVYVTHNDNFLVPDIALSAQMDTLCSSSGPRATLVNAGILYRLDKTWPALVGGNKTAYLSSDGTHPNNAGQTVGGQVMASTMANKLGYIGTTTSTVISNGGGQIKRGR
jgi:lysophospholipase L1-like esterase